MAHFDFLAGRLLLGEGLLERRGVHRDAAALELLGDRDRLAVVVEAARMYIGVGLFSAVVVPVVIW